MTRVCPATMSISVERLASDEADIGLGPASLSRCDRSMSGCRRAWSGRSSSASGLLFVDSGMGGSS